MNYDVKKEIRDALDAVKITKRQRILDMIRSVPEHDDGSKMVTRDDFEAHGLYASIEYGDGSWNDVYYTTRIARELGYRTIIGMYSVGLYPIKNRGVTRYWEVMAERAKEGDGQ